MGVEYDIRGVTGNEKWNKVVYGAWRAGYDYIHRFYLPVPKSKGVTSKKAIFPSNNYKPNQMQIGRLEYDITVPLEDRSPAHMKLITNWNRE